MKKENQKKVLLFFNIIIGLLTIFAPNIITGRFYDEAKILGSLLVGEFIIRTVSLIIGLLIINDGIKTYFK
ncbi:hypothetical protein NSQ96_05900 [Caldifermentibacillus hisashii]|uniref:Uncharacterized protein n=1 Tax=Caldifermentibacillus hisashii TaxID=996558 RepID=A0ABU9JW33_9BACI|nr:hypothetical protein [Caldibacillus thermoamylovorans]KIO63786.1 hypothetical protein B4064_3004 [Caldibacillus thermoamylovorans]MCB5934155.1 hypothetical protein [Bacillus sp. DFI.2.34]MCB7076366.1 hypothetical protein [Caldibacillus thermoamylovorans]